MVPSWNRQQGICCSMQSYRVYKYALRLKIAQTQFYNFSNSESQFLTSKNSEALEENILFHSLGKQYFLLNLLFTEVTVLCPAIDVCKFLTLNIYFLSILYLRVIHKETHQAQITNRRSCSRIARIIIAVLLTVQKCSHSSIYETEK